MVVRCVGFFITIHSFQFDSLRLFVLLPSLHIKHGKCSSSDLGVRISIRCVPFSNGQIALINPSGDNFSLLLLLLWMAKEEIYAYSMDIVNESLVVFHLVTDFYSLTDTCIRHTPCGVCVAPNESNKESCSTTLRLGLKLQPRNRRREDAQRELQKQITNVQWILFKRHTLPIQ